MATCSRNANSYCSFRFQYYKFTRSRMDLDKSKLALVVRADLHAYMRADLYSVELEWMA